MWEEGYPCFMCLSAVFQWTAPWKLNPGSLLKVKLIGGLGRNIIYLIFFVLIFFLYIIVVKQVLKFI